MKSTSKKRAPTTTALASMVATAIATRTRTSSPRIGCTLGMPFVRRWTCILVAYRHGLRVSEVCDLQWQQIELSEVDVDDEFELRGLHHWQLRRLGALEDAAGIDADLAIGIAEARAVTHQAADFDGFALRIGRGQPVQRRQMGQLDPPAGQGGSGPDEQRIGPVARHGLERRIDLAIAVGIEDLDLQRHRACRRLEVAQRRLGVGRIRGIDEHGDATSPGYQRAQELQPLCHDLAVEKIDARTIAARSGEAWDEAEPDRVFGDDEELGNCRGRRLDRERRRRAHGRDHGNSLTNEIPRQRRQPVVVTLPPAVFDCEVLALDVARLLEALAKCRQTARHRLGRSGVEEPDHRLRWLLRAGSQRPRGRRAAEQRDELAPLHHSITSSAICWRWVGTSRPSMSAVCALMTSSNLLDCTTGKSAGFAPLRMRPA